MSSILILILIFFNNIILFSNKLINLLLYCQKNIRYTDASPTLERLEQILKLISFSPNFFLITGFLYIYEAFSIPWKEKMFFFLKKHVLETQMV